MSDGTKIEWTDATVNAINGCTVLSPGCTNCYAMRLAGTRLKDHPTRTGLTQPSKAGPVWTGDVRLNEEQMLQPLRWKRPRRIFWNAHGDMFHPAVPDEWIDRCFAVMALTPQHIHQVLTKRADRMREHLSHHLTGFRIRSEMQAMQRQAVIEMTWPLSNVWLGVSVEDQRRADERIPDLLATPAAIRWLSCEPLLGPINLNSVKAPREPDEPDQDVDWRFDALDTGDYYWFDGEDGQPGDCSDGPYRENRVDWVVAGGESGLNARPTHPAWFRDLRDQCAKAALRGDDAPIPFFFKQWGEWTPGENVQRSSGWVEGAHWFDERWSIEDQNLSATDGHVDDEPDLYRVGKRAAGRLLDGVQHDGMPSQSIEQ